MLFDRTTAGDRIYGVMARILLVDDEDCVVRTAALLLESEGHSTVCVLNGNEAKQLIASQDFDLLLTDIRMTPVDGMELIRDVRKTKPDLPIIVVSAYGADKTQREAADLGAAHYVQKPFKADDLIACIDDALQKK